MPPRRPAHRSTPGTISMPGGTWPFDQQRFARRRRSLLDDLQLEQAGRPDDLLRAVDVGDAGQLHEDLVAVGALLRDARLGDAELVDAPLDRLARLHDRLLAQRRPAMFGLIVNV